MQYLRLDEIQEEVKLQKIKLFLKIYASEIFRFSIFMVSMIIFGILFVNRNAFKMYLWDKFGGDINNWAVVNAEVKEMKKTSNKKTNIKEISVNSTLDAKQEKYLDIINSKFSNIWIKEDKTFYEPDINKYLKDKLKNYKFDFNLLPPDNRIIIPELGVDAPINDVNPADKEKIDKADYDLDLYKWTVRYPDTAVPWQNWNALIFGHTSYYWWKKNPYWEIFAKMPKLTTWSIIQVIRNGKLYEYEVFSKTIVTPKNASSTYLQYKQWKFLTIMWCYPIGTDARRMMITAKLRTPETLSYNK